MVRNCFLLIIGSLICSVSLVNGEETKNTKPHFVGARSPESRAQKKKAAPSKVKNQWVTSKTHPKSEKKSSQAADGQQTASASPKPYLNRTALLANNDDNLPITTEVIYCEEDDVCSYPILGTFAPYGHVYVTGDWLFWRTRQGGMEYAVEGASGSPVVLNGAVPAKSLLISSLALE